MAQATNLLTKIVAVRRNILPVLLVLATVPGCQSIKQRTTGQIAVAATPFFSPGSGIYNYSTPLSVTISDSTRGATICYTIDGSTPTESGNVCSGGTTQTYSSPIPINVTTTIKALGTESDYSDSAVGSATYTDEPWAWSTNSSMNGQVHVSFQATPCQGKYDTGGGPLTLPFNPTVGMHTYGYLWVPGLLQFMFDGQNLLTWTNPPLLSVDCAGLGALMANTWTGDKNWGDNIAAWPSGGPSVGPIAVSEVTTYDYFKHWPLIPPPVFSGTYSSLTISNASTGLGVACAIANTVPCNYEGPVPSATICYTTDGSTPTEVGNACSGGTTQTYSGPISVPVNTTVTAIANYPGYVDSLPVSYTVTGNPADGGAHRPR